MSYYMQAAGGHLSLMSRAQKVDTLIADKTTPPQLRERLELARSIREFATKELKLPDNGSYRSYAALDRPYAVWNVVAAPEFDLKAVQSCFPVAGCVAYRGFFDRAEADRYAAGLRGSGYDVLVYGVPAYSTLGRFDDPLLSSFIRYPDQELARLIFHELSHQVAYVKDDSTFNESFAVTVEREGVRRWLAANGRQDLMSNFLESQKRLAQLRAHMEQARARLQVVYRSGIAPEAMRERKRAEMEALKPALKVFPPFATAEPNNAMLAAFATYTELVSTFEHILVEEGGDLGRFYARVKGYAANPPSNRGPLSKPGQ